MSQGVESEIRMTPHVAHHESVTPDHESYEPCNTTRDYEAKG